jgi:cell division protein FtsB
MERIKFILFLIIVLTLLGLAGYWAVDTLQSGSEYKQREEIKRLEGENEELKTQVETLTEELAVLQSKYPYSAPEVEEKEPIEETKPALEATTKYKYQELINELQELINDNVFMKLKSRGSRVGTVQEFLNLYNKTSTRVDNDFGASTKTALITFQKKEGLTADGEAGPNTYKKMIEWLKKQG